LSVTTSARGTGSRRRPLSILFVHVAEKGSSSFSLPTSTESRRRFPTAGGLRSLPATHRYVVVVVVVVVCCCCCCVAFRYCLEDRKKTLAVLALCAHQSTHVCMWVCGCWGCIWGADHTTPHHTTPHHTTLSPPFSTRASVIDEASFIDWVQSSLESNTPDGASSSAPGMPSLSGRPLYSKGTSGRLSFQSSRNCA